MNQYKKLVAIQVANELKYSKMNRKVAMEYILLPIKDTIAAAAKELRDDAKAELDKDEFTYMVGDEERTRHDLIEIFTYFQEMDIESAFMDIFTAIVDKTEQTLQAVVGQVLHNFKFEEFTRRLKAIEYLLIYCPHCDVRTIKGAERAYVSTDIRLDADEKLRLNQQGVTLPSVAPLRKVTRNGTIGYRTFDKSVIMGGKHHNFKANLNHVNRRNRVGFSIEPRVFLRYEPEFDDTKKITKRGTIETDTEVQDRKKSWDQVYDAMPATLKLLLGKKLHFAHRKDNRYRTYCEQYIVNYQGDDTQKAIVELYKKEVIADADW